MFIVDNNSYTSYIMSNFLVGNVSNFKDSICVTNDNLLNLFGIGVFWIIVYGIITHVLLLKEKGKI